MNKQVLFIVTLVFLAIVALMFWGRSVATRGDAPNRAGAPGSAPKSQLTAAVALHDFGTISMKDGMVDREFMVMNETSAPISVPAVYTSCMCTTAYLKTPKGEKGPFGMQGMGYVPPANDVLAPGESRTVRVRFDPNAHGPAGVGSIDRFVYLIDGDGGALALEIKAVVTP